MTALPSTPQAPVVPAAIAPPAISLEDIMGSGAAAVAAASKPSVPDPLDTALAAGQAAPAPAAGDTKLADLGKFFGVPEGSDAAATTAALKPMLEMVARGGQQAQQNFQQPQANQYGQVTPAAPAPVQPVAPATPAAPAVVAADYDLSEADPSVAKAFKALADQSNAAIAAANKNAELAVKSAFDVQKSHDNQIQQAQQAQELQVETRALAYMDGLASPKYGVGTSRTMMQTMAAEQVMRTAGHLIRGMQNYGQVMPIEQVMNAAILTVDGAMPAAAPAPAAPTPVAALAPQTPTGTAPPAAGRSVGSTGSAGAMMADAEYMDGARAILSR